MNAPGLTFSANCHEVAGRGFVCMVAVCTEPATGHMEAQGGPHHGRLLAVLCPRHASEGMDTFAMGLITLADLPGVPPARKQWPWVTHELLVSTIDPTHGHVPFEAPLPWAVLQPHNVSVQFQVDDDDQARAVASEVAWGITQGLLPPEVQAYVPERNKMMTLAPLHTLWQETVTNTAEHVRTAGTHHEPHP